MAQIVVGIGTSHSPLVVTPARMWHERAISDRANSELYDREGRRCSYDDLARTAAKTYDRESSLDYMTAQDRAVQAALDRLAADIAAARPDTVAIVGDDHMELFSSANVPAFSIFYGDNATTLKAAHGSGARDFWRAVFTGYGMETSHEFPSDGEFARDLIERLIDGGIDVGACGAVTDPQRQGVGHAFGFVATRLFGGKSIPMVPVLLNTYYPPNQPTPDRCYRIGRALRAAIEASPLARRVAVVASGGLSHFVTNEPLDRLVIDSIRSGNAAELGRIPAKLLNSGSSEIRNWIAVAGVFDGVKAAWTEYIPVYRTPAGTGIGLAFARWM